MRIFVTGGAGYVGSHCVRRLVADGHAVTVFDNLEYGHRQAVTPPAEFVVGDLSDPDALARALAPGFDAVMHFAGYTNVGESVVEPLKYYRGNVTNTINLLDAIRTAGVRRLVFSSTCAVFGVPERLPISEDLPKAPINPYGATKLVVEWMLRDSAAAWGLGSMALRYFNACGAAEDASIGEDHTPETHLIPIVLQVALGQRPQVQVFGNDYPTPDGSCVRDYIHVDDLAEVHLRAITSIEPGTADALNVGTGRGYSVLEVIQASRDVTGHPIPAVIGPRRPGDPPSLYADPTRVRQRFDWRHRHDDLHGVIASAWRWHESHPHGYRS
ncbi:MAG TPA: UDP-glucose 4-epimerase GalE [Phycisphaerae bacterium]|nr:UDP-glucose 4-epimerase GalE [Phycisphaerae bacterium]